MKFRIFKKAAAFVTAAVMAAGTLTVLPEEYLPEFGIVASAEKNIVELESVNNSLTIENNSDGSINYNGHRYKLFNESMKWTEARDYCENLGGHLITINDQYENQIFMKYIFTSEAISKKMCWLGGRYNDSVKNYEWITGEDMSFKYWDTNQPDRASPYGQVESYMMTYIIPNPYNQLGSYAYKWNDVINSGEFYRETDFFFTNNYCFVCEWDSIKTITNNPDGSISYNGHKYMLFNDSMNWTDAKAYCEKLGGHLITVETQEEQYVLETIIKNNKKNNYWIGLYKDSKLNEWKWVDGTTYSYNNWDYDTIALIQKPDNKTGEEYYVRAASRDISFNSWGCHLGKWDDTNDDADGVQGDARIGTFGFVCEWDNTQGMLESAKLGEINLVNTYHKYYLINTGDVIDTVTDPTFSIVCTLLDKKSDYQKFQLYKGTELICESADGTFTVKEKSLLKNGKLIDGDVFVNVVAKDGTNSKTKLKLDIAQSTGVTEDLEVTLFGKDTVSVAIPDDVPIIGGSDMSFSTLSFPVYATRKSDGTVRVGVNIIDRDFLDDDSQWNNFKNCYESNKKLNDYNLNRYKNAVKSKKSLEELKKYLKTTKNKNFKLFDPNNSINFTVAGYGEGKITDSGITSIEVSITVGIEYEGSISWQTFVVAVPVVVEGTVKVGGSATGNLKWEYDTVRKAWDFTGELLIGFEGGLDIFAGVGVKKVASVGVNGGGKLDFAITALSNKKTSGLDSIDGTLYLGIKVKFLSFTYSKNIAEKTWNLYSRDPVETLQTSYEDLLFDVYAQEEYAICCEETNESIDLTASGGNGNNSVVSGIQCSASPEIVAVNNGILMTYLSSAQERGAANASILKYMFYDNASKTWTESAQVDENNTSDWYSKLYSYGGKTYLIYSQADDIFGEDVTVEEMLVSMKITVAEYDEANNEFINFTDLSNADGRYNSMPQLTVLNNKLTALWVNSSPDDMFLRSSDNAVQFSAYADGTWSAPVTAAENINTITSVAGGDLNVNNIPYIAVCSNNSADPSALNDNMITIYDLNGNIINSISGNVENVKYTKLPGTNKNIIAWYKDGNIEFTTNAELTSELFDIDEENSAYVTTDYAVGEDRILYLYTDNDGKSSVYQIVKDNGEWSAPILVEAADGYISAFSANNGVLVYSDTIITADSDNVDDSTTIDLCRYSDNYDLMAAGIDFDYSQIIPGQQMNVNILISNNSDTVLENVTVAFTKGNNEIISEETVACSIAPGEYDEIAVPFTAPSVVDDTIFTATVTGAQKDTVPDNNSIEFDFAKTELALSVSEKLIGNDCYYVAEIINNSNISTSGTFSIIDTDGNIVYTTKIDSIPANETTYHSVNISDLVNNESTDVYTCVIISDTEEYFTNNNTVSEYISAMNEDLPYVIVVFMDNKGNEISRNVYNKGDDIIVPGLPEGTDIWTILNDTTITPITSFDNITEDVVFVAQKAPLPKAEVTSPESKPIILGQTLKDAVLTEGWEWTDNSICPESVGEFSFTAYMVVSDYDKYDYTDVAGYDEETHRITRPVSVTVTTEVIIDVEVTTINVVVSYGYADITGSLSRTVALNFDEVSEDIVDYMSPDIDLIVAFVNAFASDNDNNCIALTPAEIKAIEIVLDYDKNRQ